ncbi:phage antirepressor N-terminal domain-containing protein [Providencia rettgeri]
MKKIKTIAQIKDIELFKKKMLAKVEKDNSTSCWVWRGSKNYDGYGNFSFERRIWSAHRSMYELFNGPIIPEENGSKWWVLHKCDNPSCVNPEHLYIGNAKDNARDMADRNRMRLGCRPLSESYGVKIDPHKRYGTVHYEINGEIKTLNEWSELSGINISTLDRRLQDGWPEKDLFKPTNINNRHINRKGFTTYKRFSGVAEVDIYIKSKAPTTCDSQGFKFSPKLNEKRTMNSIAIIEPVSTSNIQFHGQQIITAMAEGVAYVAMKPIVENLGMSWSTQLRKINENNDKFNCVHMNMVATDKKLRDVLCMPLKKLNGWLFSINPSKVKESIRSKLVAYQEECFLVLHEYWTTGEVKAKHKSTVQERNPLKNAVNLLVSKKGIMYPEAYSLVHQQFNVSGIDELTADQIPMAVEYVHKLVMEGEYIPKEDPRETTHLYVNKDINIHNINALAKHYEAIYTAWKVELYPALRSVDSPIAVRLYDRFKDGYSFLRMLQESLNGKHPALIK